MSKVKSNHKNDVLDNYKSNRHKKSEQTPVFLEGRAVDIAHFYRKGESRNYKKTTKNANVDSRKHTAFASVRPQYNKQQVTKR